MDTSVIRRATDRDIEALIRLYTEFHEFHVRGVPDRLRLPDSSDNAGDTEFPKILGELLHRDDVAIFVVEIGSALVGLTEVYLREDTPNPYIIVHRYGHIQCLMVSVPYRKTGLGKQLVMAAQEWARERGATEMQLYAWEFADGPLHFYEKLGYRTLKRLLVVDIADKQT
jgi:ribosomal protein S18 acetylase RimI-like enzyme